MVSQYQHHIIRKQTLSMELHGTESQGMALQQALPQVIEQHVFPAIEKVFNRYSSLHEHITLDYLEIDLGSLTFENFEQDLAVQVERSLDVALREKLRVSQSNSLLNQSDAEGVKDGAEVKVLTSAQSILAVLLYFLRTGRLPWSFRLGETEHLEILVADLLQKLSPDQRLVWRAEIKSILSLAMVRRRLIDQFSNDFLGQVLVLLTPDLAKLIPEVLMQIQPLAMSSADKKVFIHHFWQAAFSAIAVKGMPTSEQVMSQFAALIDAQALVERVKNRPEISSLFERYDVHVFSQVLNASQSKNRVQELSKNSTSTLKAVEVQKSVTQHIDSPGQKNSVAAKPDFSPQAEAADIKEGIYIDVAGLVLLHPFLPQFFEVLGIAVNDEIVAPSRAVSLLHYLSTGQKSAPEYALVLPKILCNIPIDTPVEMEIEFSETELAESAKLLAAVVHHWDALKGTSVDGLRGTYLVRSGKLTLREDGDWLLQVESKAYDILMSSLPWSISMIQLPWMRKMLWVEWVS